MKISGNNTEKCKSEFKLAKFVTISFITFSIVLGCVCSYFKLYLPLQKVQKSTDWQSVPATVVKSKIGSEKQNDPTFSHSHYNTSEYYTIQIAYKYEYNGKTYIGDRYDFFRSKDQYSTFGKTQMQEIIKRYPQGKKIFCWINPQNPEDTVISRDINYTTVLLEAFLFIGIPCLVISLVIRKYKKIITKGDL